MVGGGACILHYIVTAFLAYSITIARAGAVQQDEKVNWGLGGAPICHLIPRCFPVWRLQRLFSSSHLAGLTPLCISYIKTSIGEESRKQKRLVISASICVERFTEFQFPTVKTKAFRSAFVLELGCITRDTKKAM